MTTHAEVDAEGQWWYRHKNGDRQRMVLRACATCGTEFPVRPTITEQYCSKGCRRRECRRCGESFQPRANSNTFCSVRCKMGPRNCLTCGTEFWPAKDKTRRYCSKECYWEGIVPTGTRRLDPSTGYFEVKVPKDTPGSHRAPNRKRWMLEHRWVMQQTIGRPLEPGENVHHKNGDRTDNRPENLELWTRKQPYGVRSADYHCPGCRCFE